MQSHSPPWSNVELVEGLSSSSVTSARRPPPLGPGRVGVSELRKSGRLVAPSAMPSSSSEELGEPKSVMYERAEARAGSTRRDRGGVRRSSSSSSESESSMRSLIRVSGNSLRLDFAGFVDGSLVGVEAVDAAVLDDSALGLGCL
jgi:hypothetical protein